VEDKAVYICLVSLVMRQKYASLSLAIGEPEGLSFQALPLLENNRACHLLKLDGEAGHYRPMVTSPSARALS